MLATILYTLLPIKYTTGLKRLNEKETMGYLVVVQKTNLNNRPYLYTVFKDNSTEEVNYYVEFDLIDKKLLFFENPNSVTPASVYDLIQEKFLFKDLIVFPLINGRVKLKCIKAFEANSFPDDISWRS